MSYPTIFSSLYLYIDFWLSHSFFPQLLVVNFLRPPNHSGRFSYKRVDIFTFWGQNNVFYSFERLQTIFWVKVAQWKMYVKTHSTPLISAHVKKFKIKNWCGIVFGDTSMMKRRPSHLTPPFCSPRIAKFFKNINVIRKKKLFGWRGLAHLDFCLLVRGYHGAYYSSYLKVR